MKTHVTKVCQSTYLNLRNIGRIRKLLDEDSVKVLVQSLIISHLDYCNSLLLGVPNQTLDRLQKVQNRAARLISLTKNKQPISPVLYELHWLPVRERINFKVSCMIYKCLNDKAPEYLKELVQVYTPARQLRSMNKNLLVVPPDRIALSDRAFSVGGAKLWNSLIPETRASKDLSAFKRSLKTELFKRAYI